MGEEGADEGSVEWVVSGVGRWREDGVGRRWCGIEAERRRVVGGNLPGGEGEDLGLPGGDEVDVGGEEGVSWWWWGGEGGGEPGREG